MITTKPGNRGSIPSEVKFARKATIFNKIDFESMKDIFQMSLTFARRRSELVESSACIASQTCVPRSNPHTAFLISGPTTTTTMVKTTTTTMVKTKEDSHYPTTLPMPLPETAL